MADTDQVLNLAAIIREVDGTHSKGAAALAESILDHPRFRAALADEPAAPAPPADGEVAELVAEIRHFLAGYQRIRGLDPEYIYSIHLDSKMEAHITVSSLTRAAELLQRQAQQTLPQGLIPMEYADADSSARIVSEPSEDGPGGCWVVRNSRHVNPCIEFPTAEAAWDALQRAQPLPLPEVGE